jgi:hypothetical protein
MNRTEQKTNATMPHFDEIKNKSEREIIQIFLNRLAGVHTNDSNILNAIYKTADLTGNSDAFISKILIDNGLRADRGAFPDEFLQYIDHASYGQGQGLFAKMNNAYQSLCQFWNDNGHQDNGHYAYMATVELTAQSTATF